jgi:hypothetical protein
MKLIEMVTDVLRSPDRSQPGGKEFDTRKDHPEEDAPALATKVLFSGGGERP